ncbi:AbrB/MazE/SpoVT family DNA-binding domain-containing protein [Bacillus infantis]|uniref:AbrB/MazE/SpoVT family DNA-binding domain-containing protein n=1 Tax=Bacillus infantis TaxID=324767 RepID=A0A5D4SDD1_9BACI|nr:AbrB/MazE/SpoVT family DNA-binding domain-containing protein [Bacillus infantis]TYS60671.1 AbrB/MazE/SpoVT family DNA-binding domain-containing protein [Bacillus infantis]
MKSTGIVRKTDELGRIVIPKEIRRVLGIEIKDPIEIFVAEDQIIFQKYNSQMACSITGEISLDNRTYANGNIVLSPEGEKMLVKQLEEYLEKSLVL